MGESVSVKMTSKVWEWSKSQGNTRLVMLALADFCDDYGDCYPGIARLAKKCQLSERTIQRCVLELCKLGELVVNKNEGVRTRYGHTNRYELSLSRGDNGECEGVTEHVSRGDKTRIQGVTALSPNPSVEPSEEESEFLLAWNALPKGIQKVHKMTDSRKKKLKGRLKSSFFRENYKKGLEAICLSAFCLGNNDRGWTPDVDWFLRSEDNLSKLVEGKYSDRKSPVNGKSQPTTEPYWQVEIKALVNDWKAGKVSEEDKEWMKKEIMINAAQADNGKCREFIISYAGEEAAKAIFTFAGIE
jgi:hypothetical protein